MCSSDLYLPLRNRRNDYLIDRMMQREYSYSGIQGNNAQDAAIIENQGPTPIYDRTQESLGATDLGITRARRRLYLTLAQTRMLHGQTRYNLPSSFFREIPEDLMRRVNGSAPRRVSHPSPAFASRVAEPGVVTPNWAAQGTGGWSIGENVIHPKFGKGVIVNAEGRGADARVQINFHRNGVKWLALEYARLERA